MLVVRRERDFFCAATMTITNLFKLAHEASLPVLLKIISLSIFRSRLHIHTLMQVHLTFSFNNSIKLIRPKLQYSASLYIPHPIPITLTYDLPTIF